MATEVLFVCILLYLLLSPIAFAKAELIREQARKMELDNDEREYKDIGGHE